jgi:hypothetical protein
MKKSILSPLIISLFLILFVTGCSRNYYNIKRTYKDNFIPQTSISKNNFMSYDGIKDNFDCKSIFVTLDSNFHDIPLDTIDIFKFEKIYYGFINNCDLKKYDNYFPDNNFRMEYSFFILDSTIKKLVCIDTMSYVDYHQQLYLTKNFLYFITDVKGSPYVYRKPIEDYIKGIIIINKGNLIEFKKYEFKNCEIILVEQDGDKLRVVVNRLEPTFSFLGWLLHQITNHQYIWEYMGTSEYIEYMFDKNLNKISQRKINVKHII